jgi:hypothetical protein
MIKLLLIAFVHIFSLRCHPWSRIVPGLALALIHRAEARTSFRSARDVLDHRLRGV